MASSIEFRLLGPLEVWRGGRQLSVRGMKARSVLAVLLLHANYVVSTDDFIDALWGVRPPATAANALQVHISALRRSLALDRCLLTRPPGYMLRLDDGDYDIPHFERLVSEARGRMAADPEAAVVRLDEALGLWRGPALSDFACAAFARAEAARLEEMRLGALEDRLDCALALGRHAEVAAELEALLAEHPLRERLAGQLVLALYRCGRQADASAVYHATRAALVEELGMEPGPALRELLERVLRHDPSLDLRGSPTVARRSHNLPPELTSFIGRERELDAVCSELERARLVTLTGAGGSGKTRLALRAARCVLPRFTHGVWLVELAPVSDPARVLGAVSGALGIRGLAGSLLETVTQELLDSRLLILLDNCEHLIDACAEVAHALLSSCEHVRILATSRQPLEIAGETAWPVPGLELPRAADGLPGPDLGAYSSVRLFAERAAVARSGFSLDAATAPVVADICRRLDGIPLAIELAAARTRALNPDDILRRLDDRFRLLTSGARDVLPRQQTLQATVDWSHELLTASERVLFRRLSVFTGGWTVEDAEAVCADEALPTESVFDVLCELVAKSLIVAGPELAGATRYTMLETMRAYGDERVRAAGEREKMGERHFHHFLALARRAHQRRRTTGLDVELQTIAAQQDNLRAAMGFARRADAAGLLSLTASVERLWLAGNITEGRRWLADGLAAAPAPTIDRVRALNIAGGLAALQQDHEQAHRLLAESAALAVAIDDPAGEAWAYLWLGFSGLNEDPPRADVLRRSLELHERVGDGVGICHSLVFLGAALSQYPGAGADGRAALERAVALAQELRDGWGEGFARIFLGWAAISAGETTVAIDHLGKAVCTEALGPVRGTAMDAFAQIALDRDPRQALRLLGACSSIRERGGGRPPAWLRRRGEVVRAEAEAHLGTADAEAAWLEGRRMSTDESITYALDTRA